jgi:5'(3')-deoxyribonucleotidase
MNIAFDIDDTLCNNTVITNYLKKKGFDPYKVLTNFHIKNLKISQEHKNNIIDLFSSSHMVKLKPNPNAQYVIEKILSFKGNEVYVITARDNDMKAGTNKMVKKYFPGIKPKNINYTNGKSKASLLRKLNIDYFVEDNIEAVLELAPMFPKITFFVLSYEETPHNHETIAQMQPLPNVQIIYDLKEMLL